MENLEKQEIKLWVDGSYQSKKRPSGVGIVITDMDNNLLEEHSFRLKGAKSAFDSELMSATIALSLPAVLKSAVKELHGDCMGVINFLNNAGVEHPFEKTSKDRQDLADNAREVLGTQESLTVLYNSDKTSDIEGKTMRRAHYLAKCALQNKPLTKCKFLMTAF